MFVLCFIYWYSS